MENPVRKPVVRRVAVGGFAVVGTSALLIPALHASAEDTTEPRDTADCAVELLESGDSLESAARVVSPDGADYGGGIYSDDDVPELDSYLMTWIDGEPEEFEVDGYARYTDTRSDGVFVGTAEKSSEEPYPFVHDGGEITPLPLPDGYDAGDATATNDDGTTVGTASGSDGDAAVMWNADGEVEELEHPEDAKAINVTDISETGVVTGSYRDAEDLERPILWTSNGVITELPGVEGREAGATVVAIGDEWVLGADADSNNALIWTNTAEEPEEFEHVYLNDINSSGQAVGKARDQGPVLFEDGEITPLETAGTSFISTAHAISEDGSTIVGQSPAHEEGKQQATAWSCA